MSDFSSLLPYNSTKFEHNVEYAIKYNVDTSLLNGFKFTTTGDNLNIALSWEYSLAQINVDDFKERVIQGLKFHRYKGTPYAVRLAFLWHKFNDIIIEEEEPGTHFAEFQIGLNEIPNSLKIERIVDVATSAAPLRSRLSRMYNDLYDIRRFVLDSSDWGDFLSDHSGNQLYEGSPKFSFGRVNNFTVETITPVFEEYRYRLHYAYAENIDRYLLDWTILDETIINIQNYSMIRYAYRYIFNTDSVCDRVGNVFRSRKIARALPVLSEDAVLEDINTCFSCGWSSEDIEPFELSYNYLSESTATRSTILISYREFRHGITGYAFCSSYIEIIRGYKTNITCMTCNHEITVGTSSAKTRNMGGVYAGNNIWHDQQHFDVSWNEQKNYLGRII